VTETEPAPDIDLSIPEFTVREYHEQWRELEKQFPPPTWDEVKLEWMWLHERMKDGKLYERYLNLNVAVYQQRVVGVDINWLRLVVTMSRKFQVHPERIVVTGFPEFC
jgi:hypothetical protein